MKKTKYRIFLIYFLIIVILWFLQALYASRSTNQIRFEELSECVRNVFWLANQTIYDGISSNIGWYGLLLILYKIFGFNLYMAKFFKLALHLVSLLALSAVLKKYLGNKWAWLPLIVIGLSPTLLYFNSLQASFGLDLQYFPVFLYLLFSLDFSRPKNAFVKQAVLWALVMIALMSYPSFLVYLPILGVIYVYKMWKSPKISHHLVLKNVLFSTFSFFTPLFLTLTYLKDPFLLFYDQHNQSGIFRGGGGGKLPNSISQLFGNIAFGTKIVFKDLFVNAESYYFELVRVEFSHKITTIAVFIILFLSLLLFLSIKKQQWRWLIFLAWLLMVLTFIISNLSSWFPGIRRTTAVLTAFYILYVIIWKFISVNLNSLSFSTRNRSVSKSRIYIDNYLYRSLVPTALAMLKVLRADRLGMIIGTVSLLIILLHHAKVYPNNLAGLVHISKHSENACFNVVAGSPHKSLDFFVENVRKTGRLELVDLKGNPIDCRLHEIYAAVAGSCLWNKLDCPEILGFDQKTKKYIPLKIELWENYYFEH